MGWSVYVALTRSKPLTAGERRQLVEVVADHNREAWAMERFDLLLPPARTRGTLASAAIKIPHDVDHPDIARMLEALTTLHTAIPGAACVVQDDLGLIGWTESGYQLLPDATQPEGATVDTGGWTSAWEQAQSPRFRRSAAPVPSAAASPLATAIEALDAFPRKRAAGDRAQDKLRSLIERVAGDPGLAEPLLAAWRAPRTPASTVTLGRALAPVAAMPWLRDELIAAVGRAGQAGEGARATTAAGLLRETSDHRGLIAVLAAIRSYRRAPDVFADDPPDPEMASATTISKLMWEPHVWRGELPPVISAAGLATCVLGLAAPGATEFLARAALRFGDAAALPFIERMPADHPHVIGLGYSLTELVRRDLAALDRAAAICLRLQAHPRIEARIALAKALCELRGEQADPLWEHAVALARREGVDCYVDRSMRAVEGRPDIADAAIAAAIADPAPLADPLDDLVSLDRWRRAQGRTRYQRAHSRTGGSLLPMLLYEQMVEALPDHERSPLPSWSEWTALPESARRRAARAERAAWIRERATAAEWAALPTLLRDVDTVGAAAVAARLAAPMPASIELTAAERAALEADEQ